MPSTNPPPQHAPPTNSTSPPPFPPLPPLPAHITITPLTPALLPPFRRTISLLLPIRYPDTFYTQILSDPATSSLARAALWHDRPNPRDRKRKAPYREEREGEKGKEEGIHAGSAGGNKSSGTTQPGIVQEEGDPDSSGPAHEDEPSAHLIAAIRCRVEPIPAPPSPGPLSPSISPTQPQPHHTLYIQALALLSPYRGHGIATHLLHAVITSALQQYPGLESVYAHVWEANEEGLEWYRRRGFEVEEGVLEGYYRRLRPAGARVVRRRVGVRDWLCVRGADGWEGA